MSQKLINGFPTTRIAKSGQLEAQLKCIRYILERFDYVTTSHVLQANNKVVDWLANRRESLKYCDFTSPWHEFLGAANLDPRIAQLLWDILEKDSPPLNGGD